MFDGAVLRHNAEEGWRAAAAVNALDFLFTSFSLSFYLTPSLLKAIRHV